MLALVKRLLRTGRPLARAPVQPAEGLRPAEDEMEQGADDHREARGVSGPAPRQLFIYSEWRTSLHGLKLVIFSLCAVVLFAKGLGGSPPDGELVLGGIVLTVMTGFYLWTFIERRRPVAFSDEGVEALLGDRVWRRIAWSDIVRIEKRSIPLDEGSAEGDTLRFVGSRRSIIVTSRIEKFTALKELVNREVERRGIEVAAIQGTGRKATATPLDRI